MCQPGARGVAMIEREVLSSSENTNAPCGALDVCCAEGLPDQGMQIWPTTGAACPTLLPITFSAPVTLA